MNQTFKDYLFEKHILVADQEPKDTVAVIISLAEKFSIRITKGADLAEMSMIRTAANNLGEYVPEPFYRGFPDSVRELTSAQLLYDQLMHYNRTYRLGDFSEAGHSALETVYERLNFEEREDPKDFEILTEKEATEKLKEYLKDLLSSNRPLNSDQFFLAALGWNTYGADILPNWIPCKDTVIRLLYGSKDLRFLKYLKLSDTIKLLQHIQYVAYYSENLKKLNLKNQDRKFLTKVIDWFDEEDLKERPVDSSSVCDYCVCFEKRKIWCGLFHHLHYRSKQSKGLMSRFILDVRSNKNFSHYTNFERYMRNKEYKAAATYLRNWKGTSDLVRHLNYILSRCENEHEIEEVIKCLN